MHDEHTPASRAWLQDVRRILDAVRGTDISEVEVANDTERFSVRIRRVPRFVRVEAAPEQQPPTDTRADDSHLYRIVAPLTGVFYRSPSPTARPYVAVGDWVDAEAIVGLIETMKIFNEVTAEHAGRVVRYVAESGQLVHGGDLLLLLEPGERSAASPEVAE